MATPRPNVITSEKCSLCEQPVTLAVNQSQRTATIDCVCCGSYTVTGEAADALARWAHPQEKWAAVSYRMRRLTDRQVPRLTQSAFRDLIEDATLPTPTEALDGVVIWIAMHSSWPGKAHRVVYPAWGAIFGAVDRDAFRAYVTWLRGTGWVESPDRNELGGEEMTAARLTPAGWERYRYLTSAGIGSRKAFMAMQFNDTELDDVVDRYFVPAVQQAGFELRRVVDGQGAGLIDDQMRVGIRTARFMVCDLTHANRGAYWESGFAEGLGKPVIYTCRADVFYDKQHARHPHFDTGHLATVPWDPGKLPAAADRLKAMVRATLPGEAKLEDS